jgi:hypothetical protein
MKMRCEHCGRVRNEIYVVSDPPVTGKFCSAFCYQSAREKVENAKSTDNHAQDQAL